MRYGRIVFSVTLSAFVGASAGCKDFVDAPPPSKSNLLFTRDLHKGNGCLEYTWASAGKRQVIQLDPNIKEGEGAGPMANDASHVRVLALTNGLYGLRDWQFPSGRPHPSPIARAIVEVKEIEAVGTVVYEDESQASETKALQPMPVTCPTPMEEVRRVDAEIRKLDPGTVERSSAVTITLIGSHFTRDSVVLIDGANPTTQYVSPSLLEAGLDANDLATPGPRGVKVHGVNHGTFSNQVTLTIK
jgi:hypothetical protein